MEVTEVRKTLNFEVKKLRKLRKLEKLWTLNSKLLNLKNSSALDLRGEEKPVL